MKAAIYSRKSVYTDKGESVENQIQMCKQYAKNLGITDFFIYEDEGFSGKNINRPEFKKMMKAAKLKQFDVLICYRLDRISRNVADFSTTIDELNKYKIDFVSIKEQFDTSSPMGRAMMNIAAVFAQLERETIAERVRDNMMELAKTGRWLGGTSPLGYKSEPVVYKNSDDKNKRMYKLTIVKDEIKTVRMIYDLFLEKQGFHSVANHLCRLDYKGKNGGYFSRETIRQIICNPVYCIADDSIMDWFKVQGAFVCDFKGNNGLMAYNKRKEGGKKDNDIDKWIIAEGKHKGIISSEDWIQCQKIIQKNNAKKSHRSGTGNKFLLSGFLICGHCGYSMSSWSHLNKKTGIVERYYRCNLKQKASNRCTCKMLNASKAHDYIISSILSMNENVFFNQVSSSSKTIELKDDTKDLKEKLKSSDKIIQGLVRKIALLDDDPEIISLFKNEIKKIKQESIKINEEIRDIEFNNSRYDDLQKNISLMRNSLNFVKNNHKTLDTEQLRSYMKIFIDKIIWNDESETLEITLVKSGV